MSVHASTKQIVVLLAALNVIAFVAYGYSYRELQARNESITKISREVEAFAATDANLQAIRAALSAAEGEVKLVDGFYVSADGAVDFIESIETLARQSGVQPTVESVDSLDVDKDTKLFQEKIRMRIETNGAWENTYNFLLRVGNLPYKIRVDAANLEKLDNVSGTASPTGWKGDFEISAFKLK